LELFHIFETAPFVKEPSKRSKVTKAEIIQQAKHYFGKNRSYKKALLLNLDLKDDNFFNSWWKELKDYIDHPFRTQFNVFTTAITSIRNGTPEEIDWKWVGDYSWTIEILLNEGLQSGHGWGKKLISKCKGEVRTLTLHISAVLPCYTYYCDYDITNKAEGYDEYGPIIQPTKAEKEIIRKLKALLKKKGLQFLDQKFTEQQIQGLYSDCNEEGDASLFDVLFTESGFYTTTIRRRAAKPIVDKTGTEFHWTETYHNNRTLKERIEYRTTKAGDQFNVHFDGSGQITQIDVTRKKIQQSKYQSFHLDILKAHQEKKKGSKKTGKAASR